MFNSPKQNNIVHLFLKSPIKVPVIAISPNTEAKFVIKSWSYFVNKRIPINIASDPLICIVSLYALFIEVYFGNCTQNKVSVAQRINIAVKAIG